MTFMVSYHDKVICKRSSGVSWCFNKKTQTFLFFCISSENDQICTQISVSYVIMSKLMNKYSLVSTT